MNHRCPITTPEDACALLMRLGARPALLQHVRLVGEAVELLLQCLVRAQVRHDAQIVRIGVVLHDAGKIEHPEELRAPGARHEAAGQSLLLAHGVDAALARFCVSHARWRQQRCTLEELLVALADTLWKGKRDAVLENRVIEACAERTMENYWDLFVKLDTGFEAIAADGDGRLADSQSV